MNQPKHYIDIEVRKPTHYMFPPEVMIYTGEPHDGIIIINGWRRVGTPTPEVLEILVNQYKQKNKPLEIGYKVFPLEGDE